MLPTLQLPCSLVTEPDRTLFPNSTSLLSGVRAVSALVEEVTILVCQVRFRGLDIEDHTETGPVPDVDKTMFDDRVRQAFDNVVPPIRLAKRILEGDVVLRQG